ncbi:V-type ATP synthase subunit E family protein [Oscillospiraceae bacterium MB08-C2-2]|nr:V-type ATP synthase subunit E family protein [Oscillospiraceae bacterium MB08-C2-2]
MICSSILAQASEQSQQIISAADLLRDQEIHQQEEKIIDLMFSTMQTQLFEIKQQAVHTIALHELSAHRKLLSHREELATLVFANVRAKISALAASDQYLDFLKENLSRSVSVLGANELVLALRGEDLPLWEQLRPLLGQGSSVVTDKTIKLGGFWLFAPKAEQLLDETLDAKFQENLPWFYQSCGMTI